MFDAVRFLSDYNIESFTEGKHTQPGWISFRCPLCEDHSNHGAFNIAGGYYYCWRCRSSSVPWVIQHLLRVDYSKAVSIASDYDTAHASRVQARERTYAKKVDLPGGPMEPRHRKYLLDRGFSRSIVRKYDLRGTPRSGPLAHRIVIPVYYGGQLVAWQARTILNTSPKYISSKIEESIYDTKKILYNLDNCPFRRVIVTEGVTDVWRLGDHACATFGMGFSQKQVLILGERFDEVYILFDSGAEEEKRAEELAVKLGSIRVYADILSIDSAKDPGDMTPEQVRDLKQSLDLL